MKFKARKFISAVFAILCIIGVDATAFTAPASADGIDTCLVAYPSTKPTCRPTLFVHEHWSQTLERHVSYSYGVNNNNVFRCVSNNNARYNPGDSTVQIPLINPGRVVLAGYMDGNCGSYPINTGTCSFAIPANAADIYVTLEVGQCITAIRYA